MNISNINDTLKLEEYLKNKMYSGVGRLAKTHPNVVRSLGLFVGVASFLMTVVARVVVIVESIFKGLIHLFGSLLFKECTLKRSKRQFSNAGTSLLKLVPTVFVSAVKILSITVKMGFNPDILYYARAKQRTEEVPIC